MLVVLYALALHLADAFLGQYLELAQRGGQTVSSFASTAFSRIARISASPMP
jgi:hypothetical protein